jgi:hypothetical protein
MANTALRIYTGVVAIVCAAAIAIALHAQSSATAWQSDSRSWQALVQQTVARDKALAVASRKMAKRYNQLVVSTSRSQRKLMAALKHAQTAGAAAAVYTPQSTVYQTVPSSTSAPAPVSTPAPVSPPTTHTS